MLALVMREERLDKARAWLSLCSDSAVGEEQRLVGHFDQSLYRADIGCSANHIQVVHPLEIQPEVGGHPQSLTDSQCRVR